MKKNNELNVEGSVQSEGDINIGNTVGNQVNIISNGVTEEQLKEKIHNEIELELSRQQIIAEDKARERLQQFSEILLPKLVKSEMLDAFSNPAIQMFFRQEQKTAICSEREIDYSILSELLVYRVNNNNNINKNASVTKAVEVIDKISDDSLLAITVRYCISFIPTIGDINQGINILNNIFKSILNNSELPYNNEWIDNAEILGIMRVNTFSQMKKFEDIYFDDLRGYFSKGIQKNSEHYRDTLNKLKENNIPIDILVEHELNQEHVRLNISNKEQIDNIKMLKIIGNNSITFVNYSEKQKEVIREIFRSYENDRGYDEKIKKEFVKKVEKCPELNKIMNWWNSNVSPAIKLNSIGRVIAHTNAKRLYNLIPDMV